MSYIETRHGDMKGPVTAVLYISDFMNGKQVLDVQECSSLADAERWAAQREQELGVEADHLAFYSPVEKALLDELGKDEGGFFNV